MDEQRANHRYRRQNLAPGAVPKYKGIPTTNAPVSDEVPEEYDDVWPVRVSSSARRYELEQEPPIPHSYRAGQQGKSVIPPRRSQAGQLPPLQYIDGIPYVNFNGQLVEVVAHNSPPPPPKQQAATTKGQQQRYTEEPDALPPRQHRYWLWVVTSFLLTMLVGYVIVTLLIAWYNTTMDDIHFGRPRTYQTDQRVGHGDNFIPSHFIALNLANRVQVIECPAGDCTKAVIYLGPQIIGQGDTLSVVTLTFKDVNGDGKLDMLVHVNDQTYVFINDGTKFRPARPGENVIV